MIPSDLKGHVGYEVVPIISAICYRSVISLFLGEEMMAEDCYFREDMLLGQGKYIFSGKDCITPMELGMKKYVNINGKVSKDKWQSMFRYFVKYVNIHKCGVSDASVPAPRCHSSP